jgi:hypothetical protein
MILPECCYDKQEFVVHAEKGKAIYIVPQSSGQYGKSVLPALFFQAGKRLGRSGAHGKL